MSNAPNVWDSKEHKDRQYTSCNRCNGRISNGTRYYRGALGYDYLCEPCFNALGGEQ